MNPNNRRYPVQRLQTDPDVDHRSGVNKSMDNVPRIDSDWDTYRQFSSYSFVETHSKNERWGEPNPPSQSCRDSEDVDPDGSPVILNDLDYELARKWKELKEIEEQILRKKAAIAFKSVGLIVKNPTPPSDEQLNKCKPETLRNRVKEIMQQRPSSIFSQVQSRKERLKSSILKKHSLLQDPHPLKLRVKLLKQRLRDRCVSPANREKVPDVSLPFTSGNIISPDEGEISSSMGFERFLSVLNKGAAANLINMEPDTPLPPSQSITSPTEDDDDGSNKGFERFLMLLNKGGNASLSDKVADDPLPPPSRSVASPEKKKSVDMGFERFLTVLNKGVDFNLLSRIVTDDGEDLPNFQPPVVKSESDPPPRSESQWSDSRASQPGCSRSSAESNPKALSRETSLPDAEDKMTNKRECSLDSSGQSESPRSVKKLKKKKRKEDEPKVDEKQEQLQNILKTLGLNLDVEEMSKLTDRTQERLYGKKNEGRRRADGRKESHPEPPRRASSRSSSSSSSSSSTSRSCSRSPPPRPRSRSRESTDKQKSECGRLGNSNIDGPTDRRKAGNKAQMPGSENQTFPHSSAAFPDYSSYHTAGCHGNTHSGAANSNWSYTQSHIVPPSPFIEQHPHLQHGHDESDPTQHQLENFSSLTNLDLSASEGQIGSTSGGRCLKVLTTEQAEQIQSVQIQREMELFSKQLRYFNRGTVDRQLIMVKDNEDEEWSEDKKPELTGEEIKANLRAKLQEFNQMAKDNKPVCNAKAEQSENSLKFELS